MPWSRMPRPDGAAGWSPARLIPSCCCASMPRARRPSTATPRRARCSPRPSLACRPPSRGSSRSTCRCSTPSPGRTWRSPPRCERARRSCCPSRCRPSRPSRPLQRPAPPPRRCAHRLSRGLKVRSPLPCAAASPRRRPSRCARRPHRWGTGRPGGRAMAACATTCPRWRFRTPPIHRSRCASRATRCASRGPRRRCAGAARSVGDRCGCRWMGCRGKASTTMARRGPFRR